MTSLVDFCASSAFPSSSGRDLSRELAMSPSTPAVSANTGAEKPVNMWWFSQAQQRLDSSCLDHAPDPQYGVAAQVVLRRLRSNRVVPSSICEFELDAPAAMHAMIATAQQRGRGRSPPRGFTAPVTSSKAAQRMPTLHQSSEETTLAVHKYRARLEKQLNACSVLQSPPSPDSKSFRHHQPSAPLTNAAALPCVTQPEGDRDSGRGRQPRRRRASSLRVSTLAREWVHAEEEKAAAALTKRAVETSREKLLAAMPSSCTPPTCADDSSRNSCAARLRKGKFSSTCRVPTRFDAASAGEETAFEASRQPLWRQRLVAEPIQSYRLFKDAVVDPVEPTPSSRVPLYGSARVRSSNLERLRHNFEHQRLRLQGELENNLGWRDRCRRAVVLQRRAPDESTAFSSSAYSLVRSTHKTSEVGGLSAFLLAEVFGGAAGANMMWKQPGRESLSVSSPSLLGIWSQEAARQAVEQEKRRLVALLESFVVTCSASTLTLGETEKLRAETIRRVLRPEEISSRQDILLLYREDFLEFLRERYKLYASSLLVVADKTPSIDIIDELPSGAEASFARYACDLLPSRASPRL
ncbi:hypothetical protein JKF63_01499 [Porcisia hertigi]|uniref:Uncharacterized protein n=1 Tax=Porcisia hertigi TaxID=2761500 RepID=A0A836KZP7_9TRYP|nr:hypothetical protein JKF63_01499 [Porcisia hertigi]